MIALYTTGTFGLIASFWSGRQIVDTASVTGDAVPVITSYEDWALYTLIFFVPFTTTRIWIWWRDLEKDWVRPHLSCPQ